MSSIDTGPVINVALRKAPLVILNQVQLFPAFIDCILEPVAFGHAASMRVVAANAAKPDEWEIEISLAVANEMVAWSGGTGNRPTEGIVFAITSLDSHHLSFRVVPDSAHIVIRSRGVVLGKLFMEVHRPHWRFLRHHCHQHSQGKQQDFHEILIMKVGIII